MFSDERVAYLFIDGAYLRKLCEHYGKLLFGNMVIPFNFDSFSGGYARTFYYDCEPNRRSSESAEEYEKHLDNYKTLIDKISKIDGFHVFTGTIGKPESKKSVQKQVDVKIAVDMLSHTHKGNMEKAVLLSGDLDFKPVLDELVSLGMYTTLIYDPKNTSKELMKAPDQNIEIDLLWLLDNTPLWFSSEHGIGCLRGVGPEGSNIKYYKLKNGKDRRGRNVVLGISINEELPSFLSIVDNSVRYGEKITYSHNNHEYLLKFYEKGYFSIDWD